MRRIFLSALLFLLPSVLLFLLPSVLLAQSQIGGGGGSGVGPNSPLPASTSGPGPVFNVLNYGAVGDAQSTTSTACNTHSNTLVDCPGSAFSSTTDVNKNIFCSFSGTATAFNTLTTIVSVTDATHIVVSQNANNTGGYTCAWGTLAATDTGVAAAATAALAQAKAIVSGGKKGINTASPTLYFPAGGYLLCSDLLNGFLNISGSVDGFTLLGDGKDSTIIYAGSGTTACPTTNNSSLGSLVQVGGSANNILIKGITFDGIGNFNNNSASAAISFAGNGNIKDVQVQRWGGAGVSAALITGGVNIDGFQSVSNGGIGIQCSACNGDWNNIGSSNNGTVASSANLLISGVIGSNTSSGLRLRGSTLIDECGSNTTGCTQVVNSHDVWFIGPALFGTPNGFCLNVDANSFVHWEGGICGTFGNDNNTNGPRVAAGGILQMSDVRSISSGTGKCITNNGIFNDNGGNSCETMFVIASGTSTGTAAVLTTTNLGAAPTANCAIGDSIIVEGAGLAGYNGYFKGAITAVGATSISYTTVASNIGALGAGGVAHCRNLLTYSGTLPTALLNNPIPNTCYYTITPIANATAVTLCNFKLGSATNINFIKASSQATTTCATAPIITISDGTVSETLTLTTGKNSWDSSVDTSTGVGTTIFKPNGTITVKYDVAAASACATPATNLAISYNITPILSN